MQSRSFALLPEELPKCIFIQIVVIGGGSSGRSPFFFVGLADRSKEQFSIPCLDSFVFGCSIGNRRMSASYTVASLCLVNDIFLVSPTFESVRTRALDLSYYFPSNRCLIDTPCQSCYF
jgi:hypothetical protein